jgi:hypothetical protein
MCRIRRSLLVSIAIVLVVPAAGQAAAARDRALAMPSASNARTIAISLFERRESALLPPRAAIFRKVESLTARDNDLAYVKLVAVKDVEAKHPDRVRGARVFLPSTSSFPQSFLAEVGGVRGDGSLSYWSLVVRRATPRSHWTIALLAPHGALAQLSAPIALRSQDAADVVARDAITMYARRLQLWTDHGTPNAERWVTPHLKVDEWFADVSRVKQDSVDRYKSVTHYTFIAPTRSQVTAAQLADGQVLGCAPVQMNAFRRRVQRGFGFSGPGWSWWISKGKWKSITDIGEQQVCALISTTGDTRIISSYGQFTVRATGVPEHSTAES